MATRRPRQLPMAPTSVPRFDAYDPYAPPRSEFFHDAATQDRFPFSPPARLMALEGPQANPSPYDRATGEAPSAEAPAPPQDSPSEELRTVQTVVRTAAGHPVIGVAVTVKLETGATLRAVSNEGGVAVFDVPVGVAGEVQYADELDLLHRSVAADLAAAAQTADERATAGLLQSAVDLEAVARVYAEAYGQGLAPALQDAFPSEDDAPIIEYLLIREGLLQCAAKRVEAK